MHVVVHTCVQPFGGGAPAPGSAPRAHFLLQRLCLSIGSAAWKEAFRTLPWHVHHVAVTQTLICAVTLSRRETGRSHPSWLHPA